MEAREYIDATKMVLNIDTDKEFAEFIGEEYNTVAKWIQRKSLPKRAEKTIQYLIEQVDTTKSGSTFVPIDRDSFVKVPIMSASASGSKITTGIEHFDVSVNGELLIDRMLFKILPNLQNIQAVRVIGESMYPTLREDDYVVIECEERFTGDGLYVLSWDGILLVKRLQAGNSVVRVLSDNQTFESMEYNPTEDQRTFHIVGKVILKIQR